MNLIVGQTTKAGVLETFRAPNIAARDGRERKVEHDGRHPCRMSGRSTETTFVTTTQSSSSQGQISRGDRAILDVMVYTNAFERIENAIFIRSGE